MRNLFTITINELRVNFNNATTLIFLLAMPLIFTVIIGLGISSFDASVDIPLDVVDHDGSALSARLIDTLRAVNEGTLMICVLSDAPADQPEGCGLSKETDLSPDALVQKRIENDDVYAAVIIPAGFEDDILAGKDVNIAYRANAGYDAPAIIRQSVNAAVSRASGSVVTARLSLAAAQAANAIDAADTEAFFNAVYRSAETAWETPPVVLKVEAVGKEEGNDFDGFSQSAPGMACMFVMMNVLSIAESIVRARQDGTFARLVVMPVPRWAVMGGKLIAYFIVGFAEYFLIIFVGLLLGVDYGSDFVAIFTLGLVYTFTVTAMGLALAATVRTLAQASALGTLLGIILAPLGGAWWPMDLSPHFMDVIGHIVSPVAWAMDAFNAMLFKGKDLVGILPYLAVLMLYAIGFFAIGLWRFRHED